MKFIEFAFPVIFVFASSVCADEQTPKFHDFLNSERESIKAMTAQGWKYVNSIKDQDRKVSVKDFRVFVDNVIVGIVSNRSDMGDQLSQAMKSFFSEPETVGGLFPLPEWREFKFFQDGDSVRIEDNVSGNLLTVVRRNGIEQRLQGRQASVYPAFTGLNVETIDTFVYVPFVVAANHPDNEISVEQVVGGEHLVTYVHQDQKTEILVQPDYFVKSVRIFGKNGICIQERIQRTPVLSKGTDLTLPSLIVDARYHFGDQTEVAFVTSVKAYVITDYEINAMIASDTFKLAAPAGTNIVRFESENHLPPSQGGKRPDMQIVDAPIRDAAEATEMPSFGVTKVKPLQNEISVKQPSYMLWSLVLVNILFIGLVVATLVVKRHR